jgi:hypothetical protein
MTAEFSDRFFFQEAGYAIAGIAGTGLFDPEAHGFTPTAESTACSRGYICVYTLQGDQLILEWLYVNHGVWHGSEFKPSQAPFFGGRQPETKSPNERGRGLSYNKTDLPISFNGSLLIADDFIRERYVHMGFHPAWKFRAVHELHFDHGRLTSQQDVSKRMDDYRPRFKNKGLAPASDEAEDLNRWVEDAYSLHYDPLS